MIVGLVKSITNLNATSQEDANLAALDAIINDPDSVLDTVEATPARELIAA